ncbi:unnamed protein product, partial [Haemonchus placei]|uniref:Glycosyltransferase family 2 protein n=1 Tax=Haemonchus placei TaxID=6290 RepID=A0A0N4WYF2_HAEPC
LLTDSVCYRVQPFSSFYTVGKPVFFDEYAVFREKLAEVRELIRTPNDIRRNYCMSGVVQLRFFFHYVPSVFHNQIYKLFNGDPLKTINRHNEICEQRRMFRSVVTVPVRVTSSGVFFRNLPTS